jgi:coenzyme F420 hydrogenase subunit gamma
MLDGLKNKIRKFLGLEAKPDAEDDEAKAKLKQDIKNEVEAQSKPAEDAKKAADAAAAEEAKKEAESSEQISKESSTQEVEKVADKPKIGYIHMSGCTGDGMSLTENYDILSTLLTDMVDIVYGTTLVDLWEMPEMDLALVEGSVCLQDEHSVKELMEVREKSGLVCAFGSCAMTGCFTRYARGGQLAQPKHESFVPISDLIKVDCAIPGCPASPEIIAKVVVALINGDMDYLQPMLDMAACNLACGCDLQTNIVSKALCTGCGTCVLACPTRALEMVEGRPSHNKNRCIKCGACTTHCPRTWFPAEQIKKDLGL